MCIFSSTAENIWFEDEGENLLFPEKKQGSVA